MPCQVIELVGTDSCDQPAECRLITQVGIVELKMFAFFPEMLDAVAVELAGTADEAVDSVALFQQEFREIGAILAGDS